MDSLLVTLALLIPPAVGVVGGVVAVMRPPGAQLRSAMQHFAAGLVFAAISVEILPDVKHENAAVPVIVGSVIGIAAMLGVRWLGRSLEKRGTSDGTGAIPVGLITTVGIDFVIDGLLVGITFAAGATEGALLTFALSAEILFLGLSVTTSLTESGSAPREALLVLVGLGLLFLTGGVLGSTVFSNLGPVPMTIALAFGLIALLYLVTEELLVEAHEVTETPAITASFFVGFILILVITIVAETSG